MNAKRFAVLIIGLLFSHFLCAASIYKCTKKDKSVTYTDVPCATDTESTLIHEETAQEIQNNLQAEKIENLKKLIAGNQNDVAKEYALKNNLTEVYYQELANFSEKKALEEKQKTEQAKQQQLSLQLQSLALQQQRIDAEKEIAEQKQKANTQHNYYPYTYRYSYQQPQYPIIYQSPTIIHPQQATIPTAKLNPPINTLQVVTTPVNSQPAISIPPTPVSPISPPSISIPPASASHPAVSRPRHPIAHLVK